MPFGGCGNALSVVFDFNLEAPRGDAETDSNFRSLGVFYDVVEGLFDRQEQVMALSRREGNVCDGVRQLESTGDVSGAEVGLRLMGHEGGEAFERVLCWIDGPNHLVNAASELACEFEEFVQVRSNSRWVCGW